jgi:hypothetical protein
MTAKEKAMSLTNLFKATITISSDFGKSFLKKLFAVAFAFGVAGALVIVGLVALVAAIIR